MKTQSSKRLLCEIFSVGTWKEFQDLLEEAKQAYPIKLSWRCIAKGRSRKPGICIFAEALKDDEDVETPYVAENYTYIRFKGNPSIFRYNNPTEMKAEIRYLDEYDATELEEGFTYVLEPMTLARSHKYAKERREAIKNGEWKVKPRGPNSAMRKPHQHHYRPF